MKKEEDEEEETSEWVIAAWADATEDEKLRAKQDWDEKMAKRGQNEDKNDGNWNNSNIN